MHKEAINRGGGILVAWDKSSIDVVEWRSNTFLVSIKCKSQGSASLWIFSGVYGPNLHAFRSIMWDKLNLVHSNWGEPRVIGGDFNVVCHPFEKAGNHRLSSFMKEFSKFIKGLV